MSWSYRKRVKISKNTHLNVSKSGLSANVGKKGANLTFGSRGSFLNLGIPGTGLHSRIKLSGTSEPDVPQTTRSYKYYRRQSTLVEGLCLILWLATIFFWLAFTTAFVGTCDISGEETTETTELIQSTNGDIEEEETGDISADNQLPSQKLFGILLMTSLILLIVIYAKEDNQDEVSDGSGSLMLGCLGSWKRFAIWLGALILLFFVVAFIYLGDDISHCYLAIGAIVLHFVLLFSMNGGFSRIFG